MNGAHLVSLCGTVGLVWNQRGLIRLQPLWGSTMDNLLSKPHQADKGTQRAGDHETALEAVGEQVLPAKVKKNLKCAPRSVQRRERNN